MKLLLDGQHDREKPGLPGGRGRIPELSNDVPDITARRHHLGRNATRIGRGCKPPAFLHARKVMLLGIGGLGEHTRAVVAAE